MIIQKLPPFQNVAASSTALLPNMPMGMTYYGIRFKLGGTSFTKAHVSSIKCRLGGKLFIDVTGAELDDINEYLKGEANAAYLTLYFAEPVAKTVIGEYIGAVDTSIFDRGTAFEMEIAIGAATAPTLEAWALLAPPKRPDDPNKRTIRALLRASHSIGAAGTFTQPIPVGSIGGAQIKRLFTFHGGNVTKLAVKKDGLFLLDEGEIALLSELQDEFWREEQANLEVVDFILSNNQSDVITTIRPNGRAALFEWQFTTSAADTLKTITDLYTTIDRV